MQPTVANLLMLFFVIKQTSLLSINTGRMLHNDLRKSWQHLLQEILKFILLYMSYKSLFYFDFWLYETFRPHCISSIFLLCGWFCFFSYLLLAPYPRRKVVPTSLLHTNNRNRTKRLIRFHRPVARARGVIQGVLSIAHNIYIHGILSDGAFLIHASTS